MARTHGIRSTYTNGKCRCLLCKEASATYQRQKRNGTFRPQPKGFTSRIGDSHVSQGRGHDPLTTWTLAEILAIRETG